ncbi:ATP-binding cassette domain-containing protein [Gracilibacillus dipsosauri]|uniref:Nickel import system ATP-binding protein NikD n=1 Tax=Gracilibacillus dipsosauri TaxID=178340 RepID=A0A317L3A0_9BACI|nr:ATP-binding cassette domain-containing protein [Gracilibacillus dipsosauri]PWU69480.1 ABC transporter ATP-binding protein [Gracilibacillus dipsosauri]
MDKLLEIRQLSILHKPSSTSLLHPLHLTVHKGESIALVGASGSGKSLIAQSIFRLLPENLKQNGEIFLDGLAITDQTVRKMRGNKMMLIPQSIDALDPLMKIGKQLTTLMNKEKNAQKLDTILEYLNLNHTVLNRYPFEISGGQRRRVLIAIALIKSAPLLVADEPTPGLDVDAREDMLSLLQSLKTKNNGMLIITHDFDAALKIADKIAILREGQMVEIAPIHAFCGKGEKLNHSYSRQLWNALPENSFWGYSHD